MCYITEAKADAKIHMKKQFYSHLISFESVRVEMNGLDLNDKQKEELLTLAESHVHHVMLDEALSRIKDNDKKVFLKHISLEEHEKALAVLRNHTKDIEKHLLHAAHELLEELRDDIRELKKKQK